MPEVQTTGATLWCERRGAGPPLLLIPGMSATHLWWGEELLDALDAETVLFDHRGMGGSGRASEPFTIADLAADAAAVLEALGIERANVLGTSMGGMVAQELALSRPELVDRLVLACTFTGGARATPPAPEDLATLQEAFLSGDAERAIRAMFETNVSPVFASEEANWRAWHDRALALPAPLPVIGLQLQAVVGHDTAGRLAGIASPTLVLHGTEDRLLPPANAEAIAELIPGARLELLEGAGHAFWVERPAETARLVNDFLSD